MAANIERCGPPVVEMCFLPRRELMRREGGKWHRIRELLFPGYLFLKTNDPDEASRLLGQLPGLSRILGRNGAFIPLSTQEVSWLEVLTAPDTYVVEMSRGIVEGDEIVVTEGPLRGHEALIAKVDRHKRLAYLEVHMFGRTKTVRVGLEIVRKQ